jgi:hypothetical protein
MATSTIVGPSTTMVVVSCGLQGKGVVLTSNPPSANTAGRILYLKSFVEDPATEGFSLHCSTGVKLLGRQSPTPEEYYEFSNRLVPPNWCPTLLEYPTNIYTVLNMTYSNDFIQESPDPGSVTLPVSGTNSMLFVDLRTQSKTLVLPPIASLTSDNTQGPYFIIKDLYGKALTNNLFISTSGGALIDNQATCFRIDQNYQEIELVGDKQRNQWHCVNYGGFLNTTGLGPIPDSSKQISNIEQSIVNLNVQPLYQAVYLPPASTVQGKVLWFRDGSGNVGFGGGGNPGSIGILSTIGLDRFDYYGSTSALALPFASLSLYARDQTNYSVLANNALGTSFWLDPFS